MTTERLDDETGAASEPAGGEPEFAAAQTGAQPQPVAPTRDEAGAARTTTGRTPLYGPEFAADPHATYAKLRRYGSFAPVELAPGVPATLAIGYDAVLEVLRDDLTFKHDPRGWQKTVPPDCPVLPMMGYRPNALHTDGTHHARLRGAITDAMARIDTTTLRGYVERNADKLIRLMGPMGEADLLKDYAVVLPLLVFMELFGCPPDIAQQLMYGVSAIFQVEDVQKGNAALSDGARRLIEMKRERPGADVTSWLIAHPARLNDEELLHNLVLLLGAGTEPTQNLIANGLLLLLSDDRFAGDLSGGSVPVEDAIEEVLWTDPPIANYAARFLDRETEYMGTVLPANQPIVISFAAANTDPSKATDQRVGNRAHVSWGAGPHACPAKSHARLIASVAIERLLDGLPDVQLAVPKHRLEWRPGPFHRSLKALPVTFPPVRDPDQAWHAQNDEQDREAEAEATPAQHAAVPAAAGAAQQAAPAPSGPVPRRLMDAITRWWNGE
ncbi:cytochrome P450 [Actinomadura rubrobrunea]|uniref:Cytochrome P450 n=1 Tax=Actinomadura rubrobrunea TaxID=115335 RepID=A0A9W6PR57_9ACTN|nr:cytochrome P450 [Actinomadura rubrobrunea]GLW61980.1 cytochrome P450 [Actinomadura rubrobrunea]